MDTLVLIMSTREARTALAAALFGHTREAVLRLLFSRPGETFYVRQLARIVGTGLGAVERELRQLKEAGVVQTARRRGRVYYEADPDCPIYGELVRLVRKLRESP